MNVSDSMRSYEIMVGSKFRFNANFAAPLCEHYQQQNSAELPTTGQSDCAISMTTTIQSYLVSRIAPLRLPSLHTLWLVHSYKLW